MSVQAIIFDNKQWDTSSARQWLSSHGFHPIKRVHKTKGYLRYRITDPKQFRSYSLSKKSNGIRLVLGR